MSAWIYYSAALLLLLSNLFGFLMNFAGMPGNWFILAGSALFCYFIRASNGTHISWQVVAVLGALAFVGELLEFAAGTAGAAKQGASRRAMALSAFGSILGSLVGAVGGVFIPLPVVGAAVGAVLGGAVGAFLGAFLGEDWKGKEVEAAIQSGAGAFVGRILGTVGKVAVGATMVVVATVDSVW